MLPAPELPVEDELPAPELPVTEEPLEEPPPCETEPPPVEVPGAIEEPETPVAQLPVGGLGVNPEPVRTYFPGLGNWTSAVSVVPQSFTDLML